MASKKFFLASLILTAVLTFALNEALDRISGTALAGEYSIEEGVLPDTTAPAAITNLSVTSVTATTATISWTAPGDDGSSGTAASYDARYSTSQITSSNWNSASQATGEPTPQAAGAAQSMIVSNLLPATTYYFNVITSDEVGNLSGLSNGASGTTQAFVAVVLGANPNVGQAPLNGVDLTATVSGTATGNINYTFYCNRSDSGTNITLPYSAKYDNQTQATKTATDICSYSTAGTYTAKVIVERGTYQAENRVDITVSAQPPASDTTVPAAIANLSVTSVTATTATISWTAPGDDGNSGTAASYDVRYSTSSITLSNWDSVSQAVGEPTPQAAGAVQSMTVSNLLPNAVYYFNVRTRDEVGNISGLSNSASATTQLLISVILSSSPSSGQAPLNGVDLTATVSGTATGNINYTFYCNRSDSGTNITLPYSAKYDNQTQATKTATDICSYSTAGTYTAKVIVERGTYQAENRVDITVSAAPIPSPPGGGTTPTPPAPSPSATPLSAVTPSPGTGGVGGPTPSPVPITDLTIEELKTRIAQILAEIARIKALIAQLQGGQIQGIPANFSFAANLKFGQNNQDIQYLQIVLNSSSDTRIAQAGFGSPGNETIHFGPSTRAAVIRFQEKYGSEVLVPYKLTKGTGFVGPSTRAKLNQLLGR